MTKVLMISTDAKILEEGSDARLRMIEYGRLFECLHVVVFCSGPNRPGFDKISISENTFVYGTNSFSKIFYMKDAFRIASSIIESENFKEGGVISTQDPFETGRVGKKLCQKFDLPLHVQIHTDIKSDYFTHSLFNWVRTIFSGSVLSRADFIRAVSDKIKNSFDESIRKKTSVLPIFVDVEGIKNMPVAFNAKEKYKGFEKMVLVASRFTKEKDIKTAIRAFGVASKKHKEACLVIVGDGPEKNTLVKMTRHMGLQERVFFEPWADKKTLVSFMKQANVFLSTSLYEGYGLSMVEAHALGVTLVSTKVGIAEELSPGGVCAVKDIECLSDRLDKALSGKIKNDPYAVPFASKKAYLEAYKGDIERAIKKQS